MKNAARSVAVALFSVIGLWCVSCAPGAEQRAAASKPATLASANAPPAIQDFPEAGALQQAMPEYEKVADEADKAGKDPYEGMLSGVRPFRTKVDGKPSHDSRGASSDGCISNSPAGRRHGGAGEVAILDAIAGSAASNALAE
jgi:hypothetical protein